MSNFDTIGPSDVVFTNWSQDMPGVSALSFCTMHLLAMCLHIFSLHHLQSFTNLSLTHDQKNLFNSFVRCFHGNLTTWFSLLNTLPFNSTTVDCEGTLNKLTSSFFLCAIVVSSV